MRVIGASKEYNRTQQICRSSSSGGDGHVRSENQVDVCSVSMTSDQWIRKPLETELLRRYISQSTTSFCSAQKVGAKAGYKYVFAWSATGSAVCFEL